MKRVAPPLQQVLAVLARESHVPKGLESDVPEVLASLSPTSPWYIRAMIAVSAWIATALILVFIFGTDVVDSAAGAIALGLLLTPMAVVLRWSTRTEFLRQLALAMSFTGQALIVGGVGDATDVTLAALSALALEVVLVVVYPDSLHRFVSVLLAVLASVVLIYDQDIPNAMHALIVALGIGVAIFAVI